MEILLNWSIDGEIRKLVNIFLDYSHASDSISKWIDTTGGHFQVRTISNLVIIGATKSVKFGNN